MKKSRRKPSTLDQESTKVWWGDRIDTISAVLIFAILLVGAIIYSLYWLGFITSPLGAIRKLYLVVLAFVLSLFVVAHLRQPEAPVEIRGLGFSLKGSAGRTVLWILCFLVIVGAMRIAGLL